MSQSGRDSDKHTIKNTSTKVVNKISAQIHKETGPERGYGGYDVYVLAYMLTHTRSGVQIERDSDTLNNPEFSELRRI